MFHLKDNPPIKLKINGTEIKSIKSINVLGVHFDSKLNWQNHSSPPDNQNHQHFFKQELMMLATANYYSILFYISEIWQIPSLTRQTKIQLMSASASPLKLCCPTYKFSVSFERLHSLTKRATPNTLWKFKHALLLHKIYNSVDQSLDWLDISFNQQFNERTITMNFFDNSKFKQEKNLLCNRFVCINNKITYQSLNQ